MKKFSILILALALAACGQKPEAKRTEPDQCIRAELFKQCLAAVPTGPTHTVASNDWDEVVDACSNSAVVTSYRTLDQIKPECRRGY